MLLDRKDHAEYDSGNFLKAHEDIVKLTRRLSDRTVRVLADEVVKRLSEKLSSDTEQPNLPAQQTVERLAHELISDDPEAWTTVISKTKLLASPLEVTYFSYLAPAARLLGRMWDEDELTFAQVTVGVGRMYAIMRSVRESTLRPRYSSKHAVFAAVPGETHTLGVTMAADVFSQRDWKIDLFTGKKHDELVEGIVRAEPELVGLSASTDRHMAALIRLVVALRVSLPNALILVSGPIVELRSDILAMTGTDLATSNVDEALAQLDDAWANRSI
ncbi:MAG: cobalamin B12-binding domain-containing protein [Pseudomonadota bacterium]